MFGRSNGLCTQEVAGRFVVAGKSKLVGEEPGHPPAISWYGRDKRLMPRCLAVLYLLERCWALIFRIATRE